MWEKIPTYAAIFVSVLALATSIWSANETRQHDRLSVQPHLHYWRDMQSPYVGLTLINEGLGPAHILEARVYFEGKQVNNWETVIAVHDLCMTLSQIGLCAQAIGFY
jgi:hypothetical protein